jgi:hypothetical protein
MERRSAEKNKELADREKLLRAWRRWHAEQLQEALAGMHADVMQRLVEQLKDLRSARELVAFIEAQDWTAVDTNTRMTALHEINGAICKLRERMELTPIDDPLPGQPKNAFRIIRKIIDSNSA